MSTDANNNIESHVQVLSYLFKGIIVTASPICGWLVLKIILAVFTNPSYFFFTWLAILGIGLLAEIFTDSWRPSQSLSRLRNNPGGSNGEGCDVLRQTSSPTVIYKSGNPGESDGRSSKSDEKLGKKKKNTNFNLDATESRESIQFETNDKQLDSSSTSFDLKKRFGKPVLLRMDQNKNYQHLSKCAATHNLNEELSPDQTDGFGNVGANKKRAYEASKLLSKLHGLVHVNANKEWGLFGYAAAQAQEVGVDPLEKEMKCLHRKSSSFDED